MNTLQWSKNRAQAVFHSGAWNYWWFWYKQLLKFIVQTKGDYTCLRYYTCSVQKKKRTIRRPCWSRTAFSLGEDVLIWKFEGGIFWYSHIARHTPVYIFARRLDAQTLLNFNHTSNVHYSVSVKFILFDFHKFDDRWSEFFLFSFFSLPQLFDCRLISLLVFSANSLKIPPSFPISNAFHLHCSLFGAYLALRLPVEVVRLYLTPALSLPTTLMIRPLTFTQGYNLDYVIHKLIGNRAILMEDILFIRPLLPQS